MSEASRRRWDALYQSLVEAQDAAMRVLGDEKAHDLYVALGDARKIAERDAPAGWSPKDVLSLGRSDG